jgi:hypothetical protein
MALVGGGGAPNVGGGSAAGVGTSLNYIGDHTYAHSGLIASATTEATQLKFTTGNEYITATLMLNGGVDPANIGAGINTLFYIIMNGEKISSVKTETNLEDMPSTTLYKVLIPPQTRFEVTADSDFTGYNTSVTMIGRLYA